MLILGQFRLRKGWLIPTGFRNMKKKKTNSNLFIIILDLAFYLEVYLIPIDNAAMSDA